MSQKKIKAALQLIAASAIVLVSVAISVADERSDQARLHLAETFAGERLVGLIDAIGSNDSTDWVAFLMLDPKSRDSAQVLERRLNFIRVLNRELGGISIAKVHARQDYVASIIGQPTRPNGELAYPWVSVGIMFDDSPPHNLAGITFGGADNPFMAIPDGPLTPDMIFTFMSGEVEKLAQEDRFSGAVLVGHGDSIVYLDASGRASRRYNRPNLVDTRFNLGSMNKLFTSVAIGQLVESGKLRYDAVVGEYLPNYPNKQVRESVTIHQLLTHTSGMGSYWQQMFSTDWTAIRTVAQIAALTDTVTLDFTPGARFQYSNAGPIVLGLIIEAVSGKDYYTYIKDHVYRPARMTNSGCFEIDDLTENLATGYTMYQSEGSGKRTWKSNLLMHSCKGGPAGGGYSTVEDLFNFARALRHNRLMSGRTWATHSEPRVSMEEGEEQYGYLTIVSSKHGESMTGHDGGAPGISAMLKMYKSSDYTLVVLSNQDGGAVSVVAAFEQLLFGKLGGE